MKIKNRIKMLRVEKKYTQERLSELTNLSQQYISNVERGVTIPSLEKVFILAEALGVCHCKLFFVD